MECDYSKALNRYINWNAFKDTLNGMHLMGTLNGMHLMSTLNGMHLMGCIKWNALNEMH